VAICDFEMVKFGIISVESVVIDFLTTLCFVSENMWDVFVPKMLRKT